MKEFTKREKEILNAISEIKNLKNLSIDNLCKELKISYSTIYSIINKSNYTGYKDMINDLAKKKQIYNKTISDEKKLNFEYQEFLDLFFKKVDEKMVEKFLNICKKSQKVFVLGKSHSNILAKKYALDLNRIGINAFAFENNYDEIMLQIKNLNQNDLVVILTVSAKTDWIMDAIALMVSLKISYLLISGNTNEKIEKNAKLTINLPTRKTMNLSSKISNFIPYILFLDLIWLKSNK